jgi:hypothetical protein
MPVQREHLCSTVKCAFSTELQTLHNNTHFAARSESSEQQTAVANPRHTRRLSPKGDLYPLNINISVGRSNPQMAFQHRDAWIGTGVW